MDTRTIPVPLFLASLATATTLSACERDVSGFLEVEPTAEASAVVNAPETVYRMNVSAPPHSTLTTTYRPRYYTPRYFRFRSERARRRFLAEALDPLPMGWTRSLQPLNGESELPLVDVRVSADGELQSMLINPRALPHMRWHPRGADRGPRG